MSTKSKGKDVQETGKLQQSIAKTEKEELLERELIRLDEELKELKSTAQQLREDNEFLQKEAQDTKQEMHAYMGYIERKTKRRQGAILSLSDKNASDIEHINEQKDTLKKNYAKKKDELHNILTNKEMELKRCHEEVEKLDEFRELKEKQEKRISELEDEVTTLRFAQTQEIEKLKTKFLQEKKTFQGKCEIQLQQLTKDVTKEARTCLEEHSSNIKKENQKLRKELLRLIQHTRALHIHKCDLKQQRLELKHEQEFTKDLQKIRQKRTTCLYETFAVEPPS